jgi:DNA-binding transcriptional MerR regulator
MEKELRTIAELAGMFEITPRAIRHYEEVGLVSPQRSGTARVFNYQDVARLKIVTVAKGLGFSLSEIKEYIDLYETDATQVAQIKHLLSKVRSQLSNLQSQRQDLDLVIKDLSDLESRALADLKTVEGSAKGKRTKT